MAQWPKASVQSDPGSPQQDPAQERQALCACPVCASRRLHYAFSITSNDASHRVVRCRECGLMLLNPQPSDAELTAIYDDDYFVGHDRSETGPDPEHAAEVKASTARGYLQLLDRYRGSETGSWLDVGCGHGDLMIEARHAGFSVTGVEYSHVAAEQARRRLGTDSPSKFTPTSSLDGAVLVGQLEEMSLPPHRFDVVSLADVIEHARDPLALLKAVHRVLKPGGTLLLATPSLGSWSARLLKRNWMEFKPEHLTYFDEQTLQNLLFQAGFRRTVLRPGWKVLSLEYIAGHFNNYSIPVVGSVVRTVARVLPQRLRRADLPIVASGMVAMCRADAMPMEIGQTRTLSVIVPAFNEAATVGPLLDAVLRKRVDGMEIEVVVVESNSSDGTRDVVQRYASHPRVKLILEDRPRGKGHAVRTGFAHATGDFVLIQDADLEYDLEDYDVLLEPLAVGREAVVLGARHGGGAWWKMRQFNQQRLLSLFFNCGHWFFTTLLNVLFGQSLRDPFTMFKVFRRDCLYGLEFKCNRFDFDHELLVKLVRKGYKPVEIPVNYRSRSFKEGKKVSTLRDPFNWLKALAWLRVTRVDPLATVERQRLALARPTSASRTRDRARAA
jgi:SAM-dependent methyltransferase